tara:strand:- start:151 stop:354 length:204 start_codon:yes stop_codon:yes gene_type:complete
MDILYYLFFEMEGRGIFYWIATVALAVLIGSKMKDNENTGEEGAKGTVIYLLLLIALGLVWGSSFQK